MSHEPEMQPHHRDPLTDRPPRETSDEVSTSEAPFQAIALPQGIPNPSAVGAASAPYAQTGPEAREVGQVAEKSGSVVPQTGVGAGTVKADMSIEKEALGIQAASSRSTRSNSNSEKVDEKAGLKTDTETEPQTKNQKKKGLFSRKKKDETIVDASSAEKEKAQIPPVGLFTLYRYHTGLERLLNVLGLVLAAAAGATQPLMVSPCG